MTDWVRGLLQALTWLLFAGVVGVFGQGLSFAPVPPGHAELKFSMAHLTERVEPCRQLSEEEREALPPTRRVTEVCERARAPATVEIRLDDQVILRETHEAAGLHDDGRIYMLHFWHLPVGEYQLSLAMRDTPRDEGFDEKHSFELKLREHDSALLEVGDGHVRLRQNEH